MTNIVPFNQAALPAFMQQLAGAADINDQAAAGIGGESIDHISIKNSRFHIIRSGQPAQTLELFALRVIIVHANPGVTKTYYDSPWSQDQEAEAPACSSDDGITPRADSPRPQCASCAVCPQNQFGSKVNETTKKESKACADKKCIAIVTPGNEGGEMLRLQIPTMSMKDFGQFLRSLPNVPYYAVVTEITFDTNASHPKLKFRPVDYISEQAFPVVLARHTSDEAKMFAGVAGTTAMRALQAPVQQALAAPPAYVQAQPQMIPVQQVPVQQFVQQQYQQPVQQQFQQPVQQQFQQPVQQPVQQQQFVQQQAPVQEQYQQAQAQQPTQQFQQPVVAPTPVAVDPSIAAIFQQPQQQAPVQQQQPVQQAAPTGPVHPSGREVGKPSAGKSRRNSAEVAEDDAYIAARNGSAPVQQAPQQAPVQQQSVEQPVQQQFVQQAQPQVQQPVEQQFGQQVAAQPQQYQQPANQPQVMTGSAVDAFAGWDD